MINPSEPSPDMSEFQPAPPGWALAYHPKTFTATSGPYYFRQGDAPGVGFFAEERHGNLAGVTHGGALLTLADMALWDICRRTVGLFHGVTVTLNAEFLGPGQVGDFIEATGEPTRIGGKLMFSRGLISAGDRPIMSFSGTLKRVNATPGDSSEPRQR